jgi:hypothetical protein
MFWWLGGALPVVLAQPNDPCSKVERNFFQAIDAVRDWDDVYKAYRQFSVCQRPYIYVGFSNVIVHLAATRWQDLPAVKRYADNDPAFGDFMVRHIGPVDYYDLKSIVEHAQLETRPDVREFGNRLAAQAQKLLAAAQYSPDEVSEYERTGRPATK